MMEQRKHSRNTWTGADVYERPGDGQGIQQTDEDNASANDILHNLASSAKRSSSTYNL